MQDLLERGAELFNLRPAHAIQLFSENCTASTQVKEGPSCLDDRSLAENGKEDYGVEERNLKNPRPAFSVIRYKMNIVVAIRDSISTYCKKMQAYP